MPLTATGQRIILSDVHLSYGSQPVLRGLTLHVEPGEIYALLGGNGAGKSTTMSTLLGFTRPDSGTVLVAGHDPAAEPDRAREQIAYVPENVALYEHLNARENAAYLLALAGLQPGMQDIEGAFEATGLQREAWDKRLSGFSKGMRQKVAIAIALLREVPVLLLDEPSSGLDPRATADFNRLVHDVARRGAAVLMVTHDLLSAADIADRIGFLDAGRIVDEACAQPPERFDVRALHRKFTREVAVA
ncbi:ATP-binding cassette domain-containing protein [Sphingobium soli]|uniref:ATP-binding cassette domain-containing protein n=1 Tax=Sphingobium soli TaxID=1591116 RepID=A0ABS8H8N6_9SPHN|nr:ATP-binding cassette domain-containing protein [Sphingobium soli]MCC4234545.1 ATP-binding cassette domain-containing protein [Sphingobium soli]